MIRVLQIVDNMNAGGIQSFIMNVYRRINRDNIQFDFLLCKLNPLYGNEIEELGGKIYYIPARSKGLLANRKALNDFFKNHTEYQTVHLHESSLSYIEPLIAAQKAGVKNRIIHSHSTKVKGSRLHRVLHKFNQRRIHSVATEYVACGEAAADWMYGDSRIRKDVKIIYNGIDVAKFGYNKKNRDAVRKELGVEGKFVIGHAGRFEPVKNHVFLLDIFAEVKKKEEKSVLLLAGTGRLVENIKDRANQLGIRDSVQFLGVRNDLDRIYQAMDCFVLPSLYEGFPVTIIEAEASGLPCVMSSTVTREACLKKNVLIEDLESDTKAWARKILDSTNRVCDNAILYEKGFDIHSTVESLTKLYS